LDYFSQSVLKPLHSYLFGVLRKIPQDMTFSQGNFKEILKDCEVIYSVDLKSATDRFPIKTLEDILKCKLPSQYVDHWSNIMVGYPFEFTFRGRSREISYAVGNPMGAYSS
jgi:hypothetical protein